MPISSTYPDIAIPYGDILSYLFPTGSTPSHEPLWIDSLDPQKFLSQATALSWIKRFIFGLERLQIKPGQVVLTLTYNHIFVPVAYLGSAGYGAVFSGANPSYTPQELIHQLKNTDAAVLLVHPNLMRTATVAVDQIGFPRSRVFQFSDEPSQEAFGIKDWRTMAGTEYESTKLSWRILSPREARSTIAVVNYSSGTTGLPKGVCVTHGNLIANMEQIMFLRRYGTPQPYPAERWIGSLPLYHAFGQGFYIIIACKLNIPVYILKIFQFEAFLRTLQNYKITHVMTVPPILIMLNKRPETKNYNLSTLKHILCGAAPLSRELQNAICDQFNVAVSQAWGMTELTCVATLVPGIRTETSGSVGKLAPNSEAKLVDEDGREVSSDQRGELLVRGPHTCLGYWRNERETRSLFTPDGWLHTGDIAVHDKEGMFWIVDRKKELIKVNGLQVAPAELESVLLEHQGISDAAVVGINIAGEELPRAYITLKDTSLSKQEILNWFNLRVAKHKALKGGVEFVEEVPKLASGKIARKVMRDWAKRDAVVATARL